MTGPTAYGRPVQTADVTPLAMASPSRRLAFVKHPRRSVGEILTCPAPPRRRITHHEAALRPGGDQLALAFDALSGLTAAHRNPAGLDPLGKLDHQRRPFRPA